ncbi:Trk family potassium uptake protein [Alkalibaculum sp. M08DMB]|uniref:Trk family potassium uptake protein n=1 Tax=Alkalibaculum sporogenes TaxID=2655001 RepID=A0A6A7K6M5_9FIRM|nr:TrkH family potassium uptake protein [Alkalibaculum sporogenes]MPW25108.1 Trk family potassium uptake protein [Alkalibaculum sporogenes]
MSSFFKILKNHLAIKRGSIKPTQILIMGFASMILIGAILLTLPIASASGNSTDFITTLFTATSAVCVTGLVVVDTATYWSAFGQTIIIILVQIGGLGFMSIATLLFLIARKKISFKERQVISESLNTKQLGGIVKYTKSLILFTLLVELIGAIFLSTRFIPEFGIGKGISMSVFHAISAFCNAGFDIIGEFRSFTPYLNDVIINLTLGFLIIIGGLGFSVISDIYEIRKFKRFSMHTKMVLFISGFLILFGTVLILLFEYNNPNTLKDLPWHGKIIAAWFQSVTPRTAGFNTMQLNTLTNASIFITIILMFIGGSPGSTAGGVKTTTIGAVILTVRSVLKGDSQTEVFKRNIPFNVIKKALSIITIAVFIICVGIILLSVTEQAPFIDIVFEVFSAFGTVGLSLGLTPDLSMIGRVIIMVIMFIGRLGPLTIAIAINEIQATNDSDRLKYPKGNILVG